MKIEIENLENPEDSIFFKSFSYDDYEKRFTENKTNVELYYKEYFIYESLKQDNFLSESYYTPDGEFQVDSDLSTKQKSIKFVPTEFLEEEFQLTVSINKKLSNFKEGGLRYALAEREYVKKTKSILLILGNIPVVEKDNERLKEFKKLEKRYSILNFSLPYLSTKIILEDLTTDIIQYIATRNFDSELFSSYLESLKISEFTNVSVPLLENFIENPNSCDMENLLKKLQTSIQSIDTTIKINTTDLDKETVEELNI